LCAQASRVDGQQATGWRDRHRHRHRIQRGPPVAPARQRERVLSRRRPPTRRRRPRSAGPAQLHRYSGRSGRRRGLARGRSVRPGHRHLRAGNLLVLRHAAPDTVQGQFLPWWAASCAAARPRAPPWARRDPSAPSPHRPCVLQRSILRSSTAAPASLLASSTSRTEYSVASGAATTATPSPCSGRLMVRVHTRTRL
jgi:hypothetical protein